MRIKNIFKLGVATLLVSVLATSCYKENPYSPVNDILPGAAAPTVTVTDIADSSFVVNLVSSATGYVSYVVLGGTGNEVTAEDIAKENAGGLKEGNFKVSDATATFSATADKDIEQYTQYEIFAVVTNADGVFGTVSEATVIRTTDSWNPERVVAADQTGDKTAQNGSFKLVYNEKVAVDLSTKKISIEYAFGDSIVDMTTANISVDGNEVVITPSYPADYSDTLFLQVEEGAITDIKGQSADAITSGLHPTTGEYVGVYVIINEDPRTILTGDFYSISESNWGGMYVDNFTIALDPTSLDSLVITNLLGIGIPVKAFVDLENSVIKINADQEYIGNHAGVGGDVVLYEADDAIISGTFDEDGVITMDDEWGYVIVSGAYAGYWYDKYISSVWYPGTLDTAKGYEKAANTNVKSEKF